MATPSSETGSILPSSRIEAFDGVREVRDNVAHAIDKSIDTRPYTTLALAVAIGFILGATWAR